MLYGSSLNECSLSQPGPAPSQSRDANDQQNMETKAEALYRKPVPLDVTYHCLEVSNRPAAAYNSSMHMHSESDGNIILCVCVCVSVCVSVTTLVATQCISTPNKINITRFSYWLFFCILQCSINFSFVHKSWHH